MPDWMSLGTVSLVMFRNIAWARLAGLIDTHFDHFDAP